MGIIRFRENAATLYCRQLYGIKHTKVRPRFSRPSAYVRIDIGHELDRNRAETDLYQPLVPGAPLTDCLTISLVIQPP